MGSIYLFQLLVGEKYEIVLTTAMGLYRYRTGDIIEVISHHRECPVYQFLYRYMDDLNTPLCQCI